ncbi:MFS transporter [Lentibacillus kapialis]|uniref:MFS transporter n=1 Tax=Lentibacillus kapialis TaxID=340214 RepID=A0A917PT61_9BACI|nr:MFS transporter [Lentibacillus kapialis]GGJ90620.1 MFS transporter [Lentibacillus kapialis]
MGIWKNHNFLVLFLGRIVTNIGDSIYYVAAMWLVYNLGGSAFYSGLAGFLTLLPSALQFVAGPFVDRWPIKRTLITTQIMQAVLILTIPVAYYFDVLTVQLVLIVMPIVAFIEQFAYPSQTKALPAILTQKELIKGNSYFSFAYQGIDLVFNAVSGILVAFMGAVTLYLADSVTFAVAAILFSLLKMKHIEDHPQSREKGFKTIMTHYFAELKEGFSIVFTSLMATFLIGSIMANFAIGAALAILPAFGEDHGGAHVYGFYLAAMSTGGLIGALLANWMGKFRLGHFSIAAFLIGTVCWVLAATLPWTYTGIVLYGIAWVPIGGTNVIFGAVMQTVIPNNMLGRISSVQRSMTVVAMPIGSLAGGYLAAIFGSTLIFAVSGLGLAFVSTVWILHPKLRKLPKADDMTPKLLHLPFPDEERTSQQE